MRGSLERPGRGGLLSRSTRSWGDREHMETAMRALTVAAVVAVLAGPAYAQMPAMGIPLGEERPERPVDPAKEGEYNRTLKELPNQKAADPWGNVRSDAPATKKPAAPAAKSASTGATKDGSGTAGKTAPAAKGAPSTKSGAAEKKTN